MDTLQIVLTTVTIALIVLLLIVGMQILLIAIEVRRTLSRINKLIDQKIGVKEFFQAYFPRKT